MHGCFQSLSLRYACANDKTVQKRKELYMNLQPKKENNSPLKSRRTADSLTLPCLVNKSLRTLKKST